MPVADEDDYEDNDDELPTVVALKPGDLTEEQAKEMKLFEKLDEG